MIDSDGGLCPKSRPIFYWIDKLSETESAVGLEHLLSFALFTAGVQKLLGVNVERLW